MPRFVIKLWIINNSGVPIKAHVGASLVGVKDWAEYYNTADDVTMTFKEGKSEFVRYLNTDLGGYQKYDLVVVLWEGEKLIGTGKKYASLKVENAVEKKKKIKVDMTLELIKFYPSSFVGD